MQIIVQEIDAFTYCWISKTTKAVCMHDVPVSAAAVSTLKLFHLFTLALDYECVAV